MLDQQLMVGAVYRIKLKGAFERHGVCSTSGLTCLHAGNGVFRLDQITTFRDLVKAGIKIYDNFFKPLGISEDECNAYFSDKPADVVEPEFETKVVYNTTNETTVVKEEGGSGARIVTRPVVTGSEKFVETGKSIVRRHAADSVDYGNHPLYKFVDVIDPTDFIYVPELTLDGFPEIEIGEYKNLHLVIHLGYFNQPELLDPMLLALRERMATYGIRPKNIKLYSTGSKWMNPDEYEAIKSIRVPGEVITIPDSEPFQPYAGEHIIINGMMKEIVETVTPGKELEQVQFDSLKSGVRVIDNRLFLSDVKPGDRFDASRVYYEKLVDSHGNDAGLRIFVASTDAPHGDEIMRFREKTNADTGPFYKKVIGDFTPLKYGAARNTRQIYSGEEHTEYVDGAIADPEKYYYIKETETVGEGDEAATKVKFLTASQADVNDVTKPLYYKLVDSYANVGAGDASEGKYVSVSRTGTISDDLIGTGQYVYDNYARPESLELVATVLTYQDDHGITRTNTLDLIDVIDFGIKETPFTIVDSEECDEAVVERFYKQYKDRKFRYLKNYTVNGEDKQVVVETTIPATASSELSGKTGVLLGVKGEVKREVYLHKDTTMKRNYYMQYTILDHQYRILQDKYNKLEQHVIATANKN